MSAIPTGNLFAAVLPPAAACPAGRSSMTPVTWLTRLSRSMVPPLGHAALTIDCAENPIILTPMHIIPDKTYPLSPCKVILIKRLFQNKITQEPGL